MYMYVCHIHTIILASILHIHVCTYAYMYARIMYTRVCHALNTSDLPNPCNIPEAQLYMCQQPASVCMCGSVCIT